MGFFRTSKDRRTETDRQTKRQAGRQLGRQAGRHDRQRKETREQGDVNQQTNVGNPNEEREINVKTVQTSHQHGSSTAIKK